MNKYDYIVVGAGSAGCVLANHLSRDPKITVLLIEAGPPDDHPMIHMPKGFSKIAASPKHAWYYNVARAGGRKNDEIWIRGKMLGGSSSINGMMYLRGHPEDYNRWENEFGLKGWGWNNIGRIYREMENHELGGNAFRGGDGPLQVSVGHNKTEIMDKVMEAAGQMGVRTTQDMNEPDQEAVGYNNGSIGKGRRSSAATAFLNPARGRSNLTILTDTEVRRVLFEGRKAIGVNCERNGVDENYYADREIVISAGTLHSPKILELSGIGSASRLANFGIPVIQDLPGVGQNLREHLLVTTQFRLSRRISQNREYSGLRLLKHVIRYAIFKDGLMAGTPYDMTGFVRTRPGLDRPDAQLVGAPFSMPIETWGGFSKGIQFEKKTDGVQMLGYNLRPESQGTVFITSPDARQLPQVTPNYLSHPKDREIAISTVRFIRRLFAQPALEAYIDHEMLPGPRVETDDEILQAYETYSGPGYHATGTCSMGHDATQGAVVDDRLRVHGVQGLRVADLSVFPTLVSGNTNGPAMVTGWRAAELILEDARSAQ